MPALTDRYGRPMRNLRLSVTDRCNLRCQYCMPEEEYAWLPKGDVLRFEEITRLVGLFASLGVQKLRLTGGEPLLRADLPELVGMLRAIPGIQELAMTSNGVLLRQHAAALKNAGLQRLTVSLDTLDAATFRLLSRRDDLHRVLDGLAAAREAGFAELKLDTVVVAGVNDQEIVPLLHYARSLGAELRYIDYMDVGGATHWSPERVISRAELLARLGAEFGPIQPEPRAADDSAPAERFRLPDGSRFGIIASVTQPFCRSCDRARLTADGMWYLCLYAQQGTDLRARLRGGASDDELLDCLRSVWSARSDRGAEQRAAAPDRRALLPVQTLRQDPHLEMHTRGG
jgi:cyclic pyranopterin phosphate synthase